MDIALSNHAIKQMRKRGITDTMILAAWYFGEKFYGKKSLYLFLGKRALKRVFTVIKPANPEKWEGLTLVCDPRSRKIITVFKNRKWPKKIRYE